MTIVKRPVGLALVAALQLASLSAVGAEISKETWLSYADALLGQSASKDERLKAAEAICEDFNVRYGAWTTYFQMARGSGTTDRLTSDIVRGGL